MQKEAILAKEPTKQNGPSVPTESRAEIEKELSEMLSPDMLKGIKGALTATELKAQQASSKDRQRLTDIDKEKFGQFKDKFEHLDEELARHDEERAKRFGIEIQVRKSRVAPHRSSPSPCSRATRPP